MADCASLNGQHTTWIQFNKLGSAGDGLHCPYVYMTGAEFVAINSQPKATPLDQESATQIATAFFFLFAVMFVYRVIRKAIESSDHLSDEKH